MLCDYVGEEKFLKGVSLYLKNNLYGNTVTNDLFEGISSATGFDTVRIMDNWIKQVRIEVSLQANTNLLPSKDSLS
jgi:aminopeptidase 2